MAIIFALYIFYVFMPSNLFLGILVLFALGLIIPSWALGIRRFHDAGFPGWVYSVCVITGAGSLMIFIVSLLPSTES